MNLLDSLIQLLAARLAFRKSQYTSALHKVVAEASRAGRLNSGRIGIVIAQAYEEEVDIRANLVTEELRKTRSSWSPTQFIEDSAKLKEKVSDLFKDNLSQAAFLAEQIGTIQQKRQQPQYQQTVQSFLLHTDQASKLALSMVDAVINEVIATAQNDAAAQSPSEHSYVFQNTFHAPVASVAQVGASIAHVEQNLSSPTVDELLQLISQITTALSDAHLPGPAREARDELKQAHQELRDGKLPFRRIQAALNAIMKSEEVALRLPTVIDHIHQLGHLLGL